MEISVADMTHDWRGKEGGRNIFLGFRNTFRYPRNGHAEISRQISAGRQRLIGVGDVMAWPYQTG